MEVQITPVAADLVQDDNGRASRRAHMLRNVSVRIILATVLFVLALGTAVRADDYGPRSDVRAIREAVPVLMAARVVALGSAMQSIRTDDVVVNGNEAIADWNAGIQGGIIGLVKRYHVWWATGEVNRDRSLSVPGTVRYWYADVPGALPSCKDSSAFLAAPDQLESELSLSRATIAVAVHYIPVLLQDAAVEAAWRGAHKDYLVPDGIQRDCYEASNKPVYLALATSGGYRTQLTWSSPATLDIARFTGRAPTRAEFSGDDPGADAFYFFSLAFGGDTANARVTGATLDMWCPFVLDTRLRYTLMLAGGGVAIGPIVGTLRDNTLHFELPSFTATPNGELMGGIDGY